MAETNPIAYHFEQDANAEELRNKSEDLFRAGWRRVGGQRQLVMRFPDGRRHLHFSQTFARPSRPLPSADCVWNCLSARCRGLHGVYHGEISPAEHLLQIYDEEQAFLDSLERYVVGGLSDQQSVVVIATPEHRAELERRLGARNLRLARLRDDDRYIDVDAEETLAAFMRHDRPDEKLLRQTIGVVLERARRGGREVRAFGEMVALLWGRENVEATVLLEHYWHVLCQMEALPLFCAYPWKGFRPEQAEIVREIYGAHTRLVG